MSRFRFVTFDIFFLNLNFFVSIKFFCLLLVSRFLKFVSSTIDFSINLNVRLNASFLLRISLHYCENKKIKCVCSLSHRFVLLSR